MEDYETGTNVGCKINTSPDCSCPRSRHRICCEWSMNAECDVVIDCGLTQSKSRQGVRICLAPPGMSPIAEPLEGREPVLHRKFQRKICGHMSAGLIPDSKQRTVHRDELHRWEVACFASAMPFEINLLAEPLSRSLSRRLPGNFMALSEESK